MRHLLFFCAACCMMLPLGRLSAQGQPAARDSVAVPLQERLSLDENQVIKCRVIAIGTGKVILPGRGGQLRRLDSRAEARLVFEEKPADRHDRVRYFSDAAVGLLIDGEKNILELRPAVRLLRCRVTGTEVEVFSPTAPLRYEEFEALRFPFDPISMPDIVPREGVVREGQTWPVPADGVARLLRLDRLERGSLQAVCEAVKEDAVEIRVAGTVNGELNLAPTRLTVNARLTFDRGQSLFTTAVAEIDEIKSPGPVDAGFEGGTRVTITRTLAAPQHLTDDRVRGALLPQGERYAKVFVYEHPQGKFRFMYPRVWRLHYADERSAVLKWLDADGLVAQCNVSVGHKASPGTHSDAAEIRRVVQKALGDRLERVLEDREVPLVQGLWVHRLALATRTADGPVLLYHYTLAGSDGQHVQVVFSVPAESSSRFGTADFAIIRTFEMPATGTGGAVTASKANGETSKGAER